MDLSHLIPAFVTASNGIRYWHLSHRKGRYTIPFQRYTELADLYGQMYAAITLSYSTLVSTLNTLIASTSNQADKIHLQDFGVLLSLTTSIPYSLYDEVLTITGVTCTTEGVSNINDLLSARGFKVSQDWASFCALAGITISPSNIFVPPPPLPHPPTFFIEIGSSFEIMREDTFRLSMFNYSGIVPIIVSSDTAFSNLGIPATTPEDYAENAAFRLKAVFDYWNSIYPGRPFKYGFAKAGHGYGDNAHQNYGLFDHPSDYLNGLQSVWTSHSITHVKNDSIAYFNRLKLKLTEYGVPDPVMIYCDYESTGMGANLLVSGVPGYQHARFLSYTLDPRYDTELFDGHVTLKHVVDNFTDLNGNTVSADMLWPPNLIGQDPQTTPMFYSGLIQNIHQSVRNMAVDYALGETLYSPAKAVFPAVLCGNFEVSQATRQFPSYDTEPAWTPVDFNANMRADIGIPAHSGYGRVDPNIFGQTELAGGNNYDSMVIRRSIDTTKPINDQVKDILLANFEFICYNGIRAVPGKQLAPWLSYGQVGNIDFSGTEDFVVNFDASVFPPSGATLVFNEDFMLQMLSRGKTSGLTMYGSFEPYLVNSSQKQRVNLFWNNVFTRLGELGYASV